MKRIIAGLLFAVALSTQEDNSFLVPPPRDQQEERITALEDRQREREAQDRVERVKDQERQFREQSEERDLHPNAPYRGIR